MERNAASILALAILLAGADVCYAQVQNKPEKPDGKRKQSFTIGKETTHVIEPIDPYGYVDYQAALNAELSNGVTPDNNGNVLMWNALGPHPDSANIPDGYFQAMKIPAPPRKGEYFVQANQFVKEHLKDASKQRLERFYDNLHEATIRPWTSKQRPDIVDWLKLNENPLKLAIEAGKRSHWYNPLVTPGTSGKRGPLMAALLPGIQGVRELVVALIARSQFRISEGRYDDAWSDLLACHRIGRHIGHGGTLIEGLVGVSIDQITVTADLAFLDHAKPDTKVIKKCLRDLGDLPLLPVLADHVDRGERFIVLEIATVFVDRFGLEFIVTSAAESKSKIARLDFDIDPALRRVNQYFTRTSTAMRLKDRAKRESELLQIDTELGMLKMKFGDSEAITKAIQKKNKINVSFVGDVMLVVFSLSAQKVQHAADRSAQGQSNLRLAFALAAYKRDEGGYPKTLAALAPEYLATIPTDLMSSKAMIYRPNDAGYLLYSVGINGKDDQGEGDDLAVRIPTTKSS